MVCYYIYERGDDMTGAQIRLTASITSKLVRFLAKRQVVCLISKVLRKVIKLILLIAFGYVMAMIVTKQAITLENVIEHANIAINFAEQLGVK